MRAITMMSLLGALASGCGNAGPAAETPGPAPREGDPALEHTWTMPAQAGALSSGDLGSQPPETAQALMEGGRMPSIAHRIAQHCAGEGGTGGVDAVVLRFAVSGRIERVQADPPAGVGACLAAALEREGAELQGVPAGDALLRIRLHPSS